MTSLKACVAHCRVDAMPEALLAAPDDPVAGEELCPAQPRRRSRGRITPVLVYDALRTARRGHFILLRCAYTGFLLACLFSIYASRLLAAGFTVRQILTGAALPTRDVAGFVEVFAFTFLIVQFLAACLLTPLYTAGAITEEKERQTLPLLLATDLSAGEIVRAKAISRLAALFLIFLAGLPFLSILQFLGGIDPPMLLAGFGLTGISMVSLTALGIAVSVGAKRSRQAIARTYGWASIYLLLSGSCWLLLLPAAGWTGYSSVTHFVEWFNIGNPFSVIVKLYLAVSKGAELDSLLPEAIGSYAAFHGVLCLVWLMWGTWRLRRSVARAEFSAPRHDPGEGVTGGVKASPATDRPRGRRKRPAIGNHPMIWKEFWAEPGVRPGKWGRIVLGSLVPVSFLPVALILYFEAIALDPVLNDAYQAVQSAGSIMADGINLWARCMGAIVACLMLMGIGLRAASSVVGERERHTLDDVLATPLAIASILRAKWLAAIFVSRWSWIWLGLIWFTAIPMGGLSPVALLWLLGTWFLMAAFFASLWLWISTWATTTQRAIQVMLLAFAFVVVGQWLVWLVAAPIALHFGLSNGRLDDVIELQAIGLTPPLTFFLLAAPSVDDAWLHFRDIAVQAWYFWALGTVDFWAMAMVRFRHSIDRAADPGDHDLLARWFGPSHGTRGTVLRRLAMPAVALLAYVLLAIFWALTTHGSRERLDEAIAEADRLDPGWRQEELEANRRKVSDAENSIYQVPAIPNERAIRWTRPWFPGKQWPSAVDLETKLREAAFNMQLSDVTAATLAVELSDIRHVIGQARRLKDYPYGRTPVSYKPDGISTLLPWVGRIHQIADVLWFDAFNCAQKREIDQALERCIAIINCGHMVMDEPIAVSQLVRSACQRIACDAAHRALAQGVPTPAELEKLQRVLQAESADSLFLIAARAQRALHDQSFVYLINHVPERFPTSSSHVNQYWIVHLPWSDRILVFLGFDLIWQRARCLHLMNECVEVSKQTPESWLPALNRHLESSPPSHLLADLIGSPRPPLTDRVARAFRQRVAQLRSITTLIAAERFRLATGRWPQALTDLVPGYLPAVPADPYDGKPLRYRKLTDGIVVYAIGGELRDHGGKFAVPSWKVDVPGTDVGFKFWNPEFRHLATAPPGAANPAK
jgi:ABC-type transport system involved in multi-copper enzyme maturation permease subunit